MNNVDDATIKEFFEYYSETTIPDPDQYPKQLKFMIETFMHHKRMENGE